MPASKKKRSRNAPRRVALTKTRIVDEAMGLADEKGVDAVTMRQLASRLGIKAMSLYNHVANKDDMLDDLVERVIAKIDVPSADLPWREAMRARAHSARAVFLQHPWAAALAESRVNFGPARLTLSNAVLGSLRRHGFSIELAYKAFMILDSYIYGFVLQEVNWPTDAFDSAESIEALAEHMPVDTYPHMFEMIAFAAGHVAEFRDAAARSDEFEFGFDMLLDGLERARDRERDKLRDDSDPST